MSRILKTLSAAITKTGDRSVSALVSTPTRDRDNDVIVPRGIELAPFKRNPVIPWSHCYSEPPIGKATTVRATDEGLHLEVEFTPPDVNEFGARIGRMYKEGYLSAFSIGFTPIEWLQNEWGGRTYTKVELLEVSAVAVPANAEALVIARAFERDAGSRRSWSDRSGEDVLYDLTDDHPLFELVEEAKGAQEIDLDPAMLRTVLMEVVEKVISAKMLSLTGRLD